VFIGHFAVALAAKRAAPSVSLGTLFIACELVDVIWPVFVLMGIEIVSISLLSAVVLSHWFLDALVHRPDLPLAPGGEARTGFGLFLLVAYCAAAFGPPPPNVETVAWAGIAGGIVTALWGYWVDRHREVAR
jgi:hypothetical protein